MGCPVVGWLEGDRVVGLPQRGCLVGIGVVGWLVGGGEFGIVWHCEKLIQ
jgi:hypothetical protein